MSSSRTCGRLLCEEGVWVVVAAIVWIVKSCVAHSIQMIMECLNMLYLNPSPFIILRCFMRLTVLF